MVRAVLDTNVFVSGLISTCSCLNILRLLKADKFTCIVSSLILLELSRVLERAALKRSIIKPNRKLVHWLIKYSCESIEVTRLISVCRDPEDNHILACALEAGCSFIVTGDKDLLSLSPFRGIKIVTPAVFLKKLK